jgi:glycosyltransferase involved in cell wall biosynthesis
MAAALRDADVALFPNRCEGGTNLVAMEAAAAGVPLVVAATAGQIDLARFLEATPLANGSRSLGPGFQGCVALTSLRPLDPTGAAGRRGWAEVEVDDLVRALDAIYAAGQRGSGAALAAQSAAQRMQSGWTWEHAAQSIAKLLTSLS